MQDGIIKGTGNSRYLKSIADFLTQYPTYNDFAAALVAGTLPIDLNGINETGWEQLGTALNKANLLSDDTVQSLGNLLDPVTPEQPVPTEALKGIANFINGDSFSKRTLLNSATYEGTTITIDTADLDFNVVYCLDLKAYVEGANDNLGSLSFAKEGSINTRRYGYFTSNGAGSRSNSQLNLSLGSGFGINIKMYFLIDKYNNYNNLYFYSTIFTIAGIYLQYFEYEYTQQSLKIAFQDGANGATIKLYRIDS